jgi:hypothetical protein
MPRAWFPPEAHFELLETMMSQIDPAVRAEVDAKEIDEPDDYL